MVDGGVGEVVGLPTRSQELDDRPRLGAVHEVPGWTRWNLQRGRASEHDGALIEAARGSEPAAGTHPWQVRGVAAPPRLRLHERQSDEPECGATLLEVS